MNAQSVLEFMLILSGAVILAALVLTLILSFQTAQTGSGDESGIAQSGAGLVAIKQLLALGFFEGKYSFDGTTADSSGKNRDATTVGGLNFSYVKGKRGSALNTRDPVYVAVPPSALNGLKDFTIMTWAQMDHGLTDVISTGPGGNVNIQMSFGSSVMSLTEQYEATPIPAQVPRTPKDWYHIVFTKQGKELNAYINCNLVGNATLPVDTTATADEITMNSLFAQSVTFDETYFLNHALSKEQIKSVAGC